MKTLTSLISSLALSLLNGGNSKVSQDIIFVRLSLGRARICVGQGYALVGSSKCLFCVIGLGSWAAGCYQSSV